MQRFKFNVVLALPLLLAVSSANAQGINTAPLSELLERATRSVEDSVRGQGGAQRLFNRYKERGDTEALRDLARLAATPGNAQAANYMGCIYGLGIGREKNEARAANFFQSAAAGSPLAAYNLGLIFSKRKDHDRAFRAMESAWSRGGIEQAGAWLLTMRLQRNLDASQLIRELDFIQSPVGQYHEARRLFDAKDYRAALGKLVGPTSYGLVGSHGLKARLFLDAHITSPSKFFDWAAGLSYLYIEMGVSGERWGLPEQLPASRVGASRSWFGDIYHQIEDVNREAYSRASQWFASRKERPTRYEEFLCEVDRVFDRRAYRLVNQ